MEDNNKQHILGFSTKEALIRLRNDIECVINEHKQKNLKGYVGWVIYVCTIFEKNF